MNGATESVVFCEGYHDRAFWAGWLLYLGCTDPGIKPGKSIRDTVLDPWGEAVKGGVFAFLSRSGHFVRVAQCGGKNRIIPLAERRLRQRTVEHVKRLCVNVDADVHVDGTPMAVSPITRAAVEDVMRRVDPAITFPTGTVFPLDGGATQVCLIRWEAPDPSAPGLPNQQTLERLACSAICAAYPDRGPAVQQWLDSRPDPPDPCVKEHAWSQMAGWYAEHGCEDFYRHLWDDPRIAAELEPRLRASGAWQIVEALAA
jgi:hypothetical protein